MIQVKKDGTWMRVDPQGAQMLAYCDKVGRQRLWSGDPAVWGKVAPVLFPLIGVSNDGQVLINGKRYPAPRHGLVRDLPFVEKSRGGDFCTLELVDSAESRAVYPFPFRLTVTHRLLPTGFATEITVENLGNRRMPFALGGHPGFTCPMQDGEAFSDYILRFEEPEEGKTLLCNEKGLIDGTAQVDLGPQRRILPLAYEVFDQMDTLIFAGLHSRSVELIHRQTGTGIRFHFPQSPVLALWTMPHQHAPYLCLEPWNGLPGRADQVESFHDKPYHEELDPGQGFTMEYRMEMIG